MFGEATIVYYIWVFPKIGAPQNGCFIRENPIGIDDLGYPYFRKPSPGIIWRHPIETTM